jgi:hypothetical protein
VLRKSEFFLLKNRARDFIRWWSVLIFLLGILIVLVWLASFIVVEQKISGLGLLLQNGELSQIVSKKAGTMMRWLVDEGDPIKQNDIIALVQDHSDPPHTYSIHAPLDGVVAEIIAYQNTPIENGEVIALISKLGDPRKDLELVGFVSSLEGKKIALGMKAIIDPTITDAYIHGHVEATVKRVGRLPVTKAAITSIVKLPEVAKYIRRQIEGEPFVVELSLTPDEHHKTGYRWSGPGPDFILDSGVFGHFYVIYDEPTILSLLWPSLFRRFRG